MEFYSKRLVGFFLLACSFFSPALAEDANDVLATAIVSQLKSARSDLNYRFIGPSAIPSFYEVQVEGGPMLYVTEDGSFFFDGNLYKVKVGQFVDVRNLKLDAERKKVFASMSTDTMTIFKAPGKTKAIVNVFTDIDCGFCRKLHKEVPKLNQLGIEVRYLAYPRAGIPSEAYNKIATAWCSANPQESLTRFKNGNDDPIAVCDDNPVADHFELGARLGVTGTPAIMLMDGSLLPGYKKADELAKILGLGS
jgi:thiol:disulfide interchange protein DsbC|tara:strand:- start:1624 stop:2376 length:753 start_codon:yes stop_codon:yes gene_type:complete